MYLCIYFKKTKAPPPTKINFYRPPFISYISNNTQHIAKLIESNNFLHWKMKLEGLVPSANTNLVAPGIFSGYFIKITFEISHCLLVVVVAACLRLRPMSPHSTGLSPCTQLYYYVNDFQPNANRVAHKLLIGVASFFIWSIDAA